jgi:hypothetical protein
LASRLGDISYIREKRFFQNFLGGLEEGYEEQDKRIAKDQSDNLDKVKEGSASGLAEGLANSFNWLKALLK